ncbi:MAG: hypothetical protein O6761_03720 [Thaumarchaeota archaeon]|nr:hypothetical protein [Nitrososphaerota archaeon]
MSEKVFEYKGKKINVRDTDAMKLITIDDKEIMCIYDKEMNVYKTHALPYVEFSSLEDLVHNLIDFSPEVKSVLDHKTLGE